MAALTLEQTNRLDVLNTLTDDAWLIACLCAAWCDVCKSYRPQFDALAAQHTDKRFVWIDIEDQADIVGDLDIENFPTLLLQRGNTVAFFGTVQPDAQVASRLLHAAARKDIAELQAEATGSAERRQWQEECNLWQRLRQAAAQD